MSKNLLLILGLLLCGLAFSSRAEAGLDPIVTGGWTQPNLAYGNGNMIVNGRFNNLLAVFASSTTQYGNSDIIVEKYDPLTATWMDHQLTMDGFSYQPTVAMDSSGLAVVAWVNRSYVIPSLWYAYQTQVNCESCWSQPQEIVFLGGEPSIAAENGIVHLTWTTRDRVHYTTFPMAAPPFSPILLGDVVDTVNCANTGFYQPSIALSHPPCGPLIVRIAALLVSNEQSTVGPCHATDTKSGPRVYEQDNTLAWSQVFQEVVSDPAPGQSLPAPVSISLNANRLTGDFYLAWSEEQNQVARTRTVHGKGANWDASQLIDNQQHHVHVAAKGAGNAGHFRLAVSDPDWSTNGYSQTGKWSGGGLNWTGSSLPIPDSIRPFIAYPQALYWNRCGRDDDGNNMLSEIKIYTGAGSTILPPTDMATDLSQTGVLSCRLATLPDGAVPGPHCFDVNLSVSRMSRPEGGDAVLVDAGDYAIVTQLSATGAEITTLAGDTIQATWSAGDVISSWDNGFAITAPRESLKLTSKNARFHVQGQ